MDTALPPKQADPRDVLIERADEELAHAYEQISRADEEIARAEERLSKLEHDDARTAARRKRPSVGGRAVRGFTGLMLTACICVAAIVWPTAMRPSRLSRGGRRSSSRLHRCRSKTRGFPRSRPETRKAG